MSRLLGVWDMDGLREGQAIRKGADRDSPDESFDSTLTVIAQ